MSRKESNPLKQHNTPPFFKSSFVPCPCSEHLNLVPRLPTDLVSITNDRPSKSRDLSRVFRGFIIALPSPRPCCEWPSSVHEPPQIRGVKRRWRRGDALNSSLIRKNRSGSAAFTEAFHLPNGTILSPLSRLSVFNYLAALCRACKRVLREPVESRAITINTR